MPKARPFNTEQHATNMAALPEVAYAKHMLDDSVILITRGESGYYPVDTDKFPAAISTPDIFIRKLNMAMGVSPSQAEAMMIGSLFGWDVPGANPAMYARLDQPVSA